MEQGRELELQQGMEHEFHSLVEIVHRQALEAPDKLVLTFLADGSIESAVNWTRERLDRRARAIASALRRSGKAYRRPVLLMLPPGPEFVAAFFGCLYAHAIAVPMTPPGLARMARTFARLARIVSDSESQVFITTDKLSAAVDGVIERLEVARDIQILKEDEIEDDLAAEWTLPAIQPGDIGWLQYTSGSTSDPKGVMVSHGNIIANLDCIIESMEINREQPMLSWLPPFHDMGLVGGILTPVYRGLTAVLMPPMSFLLSPYNWMRAASHYKAQVTGGPNFAYDACCDKIKEEKLETLDLSRLRVCYCGSEPIRYRTVVRFIDYFKKAKLQECQFYPCYGLAENTLFSAGKYFNRDEDVLWIDREKYAASEIVPASPEAESSMALCSSGRAGYNNAIRIVDPDTLEAKADGEIGEIWIGGPCIAKGYWKNPAVSEATFGARIAGTGEGPFMRTGDLGFLAKGSIYISGRCKEMIIINGRNFFPQDLEQSVVQSVAGLEQNGAAAFGVDVDGREGLVVVFEAKMPKEKLEGALAEIRQILSEEFDVRPHAVVLVKRHSVPKTTSGKIQQAHCRQLYLDGELPVLAEWREQDLEGAADAWGAVPGTEQEARDDARRRAAQWEDWLKKGLSARLGAHAGAIASDTPFSALGLNSSAAVALAKEIGDACGRSLPATLVYDYGCVRDLAAFLAGAGEGRAASAAAGERASGPVAVIGMALRFPGASTPEAFAGELFDGIDAITEVPAERWDASAIYSPDPDAEMRSSSRWGGFVDGMADFDPEFFGISPREAGEIDPQQRQLLEVAWEALERAGIAPGSLAGSRTGVFVGISQADYERLRMASAEPLTLYSGTGSARSIAANRISYVLGLEGPSLAVDTACSSSLVALHLACQSIRQGESSLALAAGVNILAAPEGHIVFSKARLMAADGRCKTFSDDADGYVRAEGCAVLVLKSLERAQADGDRILGVVRGTAVNQDGRSNGLTAPSRRAQRRVILEALANAGLKPSDIDLVEAHGTGTKLGDPIEFGALADVFAGTRPEGRPLVLSSVKTNIGHAEAAAGLAGVCRVLVALGASAIPPHLHLKKVNPEISLDAIPAVIPTGAMSWEASPDRVRRAGVSSFGFGGTNAHAIIEEAPRAGLRQPRTAEAPVLALSARSDAQLKSLAQSYLLVLQGMTPGALQDFCMTACTGRTAFACRLALAGDVARKLAGFAAGQRMPHAGHAAEADARRLPVLLFDGGARDLAGLEPLAARSPLFREAFEAVSSLAEKAGRSIRSAGNADAAAFCADVALAAFWRAVAGDPAEVLYHGRGVFAAGVAAGVWSAEAALAALLGTEGVSSPSAPRCRLFSLDAQKEVAAEAAGDQSFFDHAGEGGRSFVLPEEAAGRPVLCFASPDQARAHPDARLMALYPEGGRDAWPLQAEACAALWAAGADIAWDAFWQGSGAQKMVLPTYPFDNRRFWFAAGTASPLQAPSPVQSCAPCQTAARSCAKPEALAAGPACAAPAPGSVPPQAPEASETAAPGREALADRLEQAVRRIMRLGPQALLDRQASLIQQGFDSLLFMELARQIRKETGLALSPALFAQNPTIDGMAEVLASGAGQDAGDEDLALAADPARRFERFPLTDVQHAYWLGRGASMPLGGVSCSSYLEADLEGIDLARLEEALNRLVERHDMLRCVISSDGWQRCLPEVPRYLIEIEDLSGLDNEKKSEILTQKREALSHKVLPVDKAPILEVKASLLGQGRIRIHLKQDLLVADAFSFGILARDLAAFYADPGLRLPALQLSFRDYVLAGEAEKQTRAWASDREYWLSRMADLPEGPELPLAKSPEAAGTPRFARRTARLGREAWQRLKALASRRNLTPSALLLSAFSMVLARWCASPRFCLMLTTFDRRGAHPQISEIVGDFTRLLLLEVERKPMASFAEHAAGVAARLADDLSHSRFSAVDLLRELARGAENAVSSRSAVVFTSALPLTSTDDPFAPLEGIACECPYAISQTPQVWLDHQVYEYKGELVYTWDSVDALFPDGLVDALFETYSGFVARLAEDEALWEQKTPLAALPASQAKVRAEANATGMPFAPGLLQDALLARAAAAPQAPAILSPSRSLSFAELEDASRRLALRLAAMGVPRGGVAAVMMAKGWEQIVAVLACVRAGCAYLPCDAELPEKRLAYMFKDAGVTVCLVQEAFADKAERCGAQAFAVDGGVFSLPGGALPEDRCARPEDRAYVIYTSGSTGTPKGVAMQHQATLNTLADLWKRLELTARDRVLSLANLHFDLSVFDVFGVLGAGGAVVFPDPRDLKKPGAWCARMREAAVTVWNTTPSVMQLLLDYLDDHPEEKPEGLGTVIMSGDWIPVDMPGRIHALWPACRVCAMGGATEAAIWSNIQVVDEVPASWRSIPYGRPLGNQRYYVLDDEGSPCPDYVPGSLFIAGQGLAEGYLNDPEKTRASFFVHPGLGERLYRTGDLGRYWSDGTLEFLGRRDSQVKVNGYRVELGEIETALRSCEGVQNAAVVAVKGQGGVRLAGFVAMNAQAGGPEAGETREEYEKRRQAMKAAGIEIIDAVDRLHFKQEGRNIRRDTAGLERVCCFAGEPSLEDYSRRISTRRFLQEAVPAERLKGLLHVLAALNAADWPVAKYRYGSAGWTYAVQTYVLVKEGRVEGLAPGLWYFNPLEDALYRMGALPEDLKGLFPGQNADIFESGAFAVFLVAEFDAIRPVYGDRAGDFTLIEAGLMSQLLEEEAMKAGLGLCQIGAMDFGRLREGFRLKESHSYLHCLVGGLVARPEGWVFTQASRESLPDQGTAPAGGADALKAALHAWLPDYMVPQTLVQLEAIPLTANGKVDRKALLRLAESGRRGAGYAAPEQGGETLLAGLIGAILGREKVSVLDNFFDLGATSLQLVLFQRRVNEALGREVPITDIFAHPSIRELNAFLSAADGAGGDGEAVLDEAEKRACLRRRMRKDARRRTHAWDQE